MRKILWVFASMLVLWCIWWAIAAFGLRAGIEAWLDERRGFGWQADTETHRVAGFPLRIESDMTGLSLANPERSGALYLPRMTISAPAWWPGDVTVAFSDQPNRFVTADATYSVEITDAKAALRLHPGTALELEGMSMTAGPWRMDAENGGLYAADRLTLQMSQSFDTAEVYHFFATAPVFTFGDATRARLNIPADWPVAFDRLELDGTVTFDRPWDIRAVEERAPQPRIIKLKLAEAAWGELRLFAAADLVVDEAGVPTGTVNLQAENWGQMLDIAQEAGLLPDAIRGQAQEGLDRLARMSGDPTALDVQLNLRGGFLAVGIIPIGPAPRIFLR